MLSTAAQVAWGHCLRGGEYTWDNKKAANEDLPLLWGHIRIVTRNNQLCLRIKIPKSKTDQLGKGAWTTSTCTCHTAGVCALHALLTYRDLFRSQVGPLSRTNHVFCFKSRKTLTKAIFNAQIKKWCTQSQHSFNPKKYSSHGFRAGKCTELFRAGTKDFVIEKLGRWASGCWKKYYVKLDLTDLIHMSALNYK